MKFVVTAHSDTGIRKQVNQDSLCVKVADTVQGQVVMGVVCDGMGGLKKGELASATAVRGFSEWFEEQLPDQIGKNNLSACVKEQWQSLIQSINSRMLVYSTDNNISLGTTLTAVLIYDGRYLITNIGDSRIYQLNDRILQLTTDHTLVQKEIKEGKITQKEAKEDPRKSILTQCLGASRVLEPQWIEGQISTQEIMLLCTDGFRNKLSEEEMFGVLSPRVLSDPKMMKDSIVDLTELVKTRRETDNISALMIRTI